ncbi:MAG: hypothetical protein II475_03500, partial [Bacteroidales bacterium]|nr:hypothetical protein [Bacteroidales bacterium]
DEYVFMLYRAMLYSRRGEYTFNRLLNDNPNLACEINKSALSKVTSEKLAGKPFIVLLGAYSGINVPPVAVSNVPVAAE